MELWLPIPDYPNYEISSEGRVWNKKRGVFLTPCAKDNGYLTVTLCNKNGHKSHYVHRLVARTFYDTDVDNRPQVNHIDGNKANNFIGNLELCTNAENLHHAFRTGLKRGSGPYPYKKVRVVETGEVYSNLHECARAIDGREGSISHCLKGNRKTHRGYHFEEVV